MLQTLLAERFHVKIHRESREMPVFDLVVDKNGPKMKESAPGTESKTEALPGSPGISKRKYWNLSMADLVLRIGSNFDHPLLDRTGLNGRYDIELEFSSYPQQMTAAEEAAFAARGVPSGGVLPISRALPEQLGLKVVAAKESVETITIDHAEKPSEN
jgi:uncharacterized protein (TIGR03435 family)